MHKALEKQLRERAVFLGNSGDGNAFPELETLLSTPSAQVRRLAASAVGKLIGLINANQAVAALAPLLRDNHPQAKQYAIKAIKAFGVAGVVALHDLKDICNNPAEKDYNRRDAQLAIEVIEEASRIAEKQAIHTCQRCGVKVDSDEYAKSMRAFDRPFCDKCFDETYLHRRNFDTKVELNKTIVARDGTLVQSHGERIVAEFLSEHGIQYRYDERIRIVQGLAIRPDFYLPEFDLYIEYWGMTTIDYKMAMLKKRKLYQQEGKRLVSVYYSDMPNLVEVLRQKLSRYIAIR